MTNQLIKRPIESLKSIIDHPSVKQQFQQCLGNHSDAFMASIIECFSTSTYLQKCSPKDIIQEALKAATLKLPINASLGFAYIVPYKGKAQMQIGYKGLVQLAQRTGFYRFINSGIVYDGQLISENMLTGEIVFDPSKKKSDMIIGYFAYFQLLNGFEKTMFWTVDHITNHAKRYSQSFNSSHSPWKSDFDAMAMKTMLKQILKFGPMTTEMMTAMANDEKDSETTAFDEINGNANADVIIDIEPSEISEEENKRMADSFDNGPDNKRSGYKEEF